MGRGLLGPGEWDRKLIAAVLSSLLVGVALGAWGEFRRERRYDHQHELNLARMRKALDRHPAGREPGWGPDGHKRWN